MIVAADSLIAPISNRGWERPLFTDYDRNFSFPNGYPGLIQGIVTKVPKGSDIFPYSAFVSDVENPNCQLVSVYTPPNKVVFSATVGGAAVRSFGCEHDAVIKDMGGSDIDFFRDGVRQGCFGTFSKYRMGVTYGANVVDIVVTYGGVRGGVFFVDEYEGGADGVVTVDIRDGSPYAVKALRLSDNTYQVLANGGLVLTPGYGSFNIRATWAGAATCTDVVYKCKYIPEIPYGL